MVFKKKLVKSPSGFRFVDAVTTAKGEKLLFKRKGTLGKLLKGKKEVMVPTPKGFKFAGLEANKPKVGTVQLKFKKKK